MTDKFEGCEVEVYFDPEIGHNVTLIKDSTGRLSSSRKEADRRAKEKGFTDIHHLEGFMYANGLFNDMRSGYDCDVLNIHLSQD